MDSLNFLKFKPLTNWLDYFLERSKFFALIEDENKDENTIVQLLDQFIEQAMNSAKEVTQLEIKEMDEDDVIYMRHKVNELWLCALCSFAAIDWDIFLLMKNSNILKIQALMTRLCLWAFNDILQLEKISNETNKNENFFCLICQLEDRFSSSSKIFVLYLYSIWVLIIDINARFPVPSVKPTVSNPFNQVDQTLLQAERITNIVADIRKNVKLAVQQLTHLSFSNLNVKLYCLTPKCFYIDEKAISSTSLTILKNGISPNFELNDETFFINELAFKTKINFLLMTAHFAVKHFTTAKNILTKVNNNLNQLRCIWYGMNRTLQRIFRIDEKELNAYLLSLNISDKSQNEIPKIFLPATPNDVFVKTIITTTVKRANLRPLNVLQSLLHGSCIFNRFLTLMSVENFRHEFIDAVSNEIFLLKKNKSQLTEYENYKRLHLYSALYFFCLFTSGFTELITSHFQLGSVEMWRCLATTIETPVSELPNNVILQVLSTTGPPIWNVLTSFNLDVICNGLKALGTSFKLPSKHKFSEVIGETLLDRLGPIYNQVVLYLWKLEQLIGLNNSMKWQEFINGFMTYVIQDIMDNQLQELVPFDLIRAEIDIWNRQLCRVENSEEFVRRTAEYLNLTSKLLHFGNTGKTPFIKFILPLLNFLLNNRCWKLIIAHMENKSFDSPFTNLSKVLAGYFMHESNNQSSAKNNLASTAFCKIMWPTFELQKESVTNANRRQGSILLTKQQFLDFILNLKESKILDFLFGYVTYLINTYLKLENSDKQSQHSTGLLAAFLTQKLIFSHMESDIWRQVHCDASSIDFEYCKSILEILCKNAMLLNPINVNWLRICGDFYFVTERFEQSIAYYLEVVIAARRKFCVNVLDFDLDDVFTKISIGCTALNMPTLAAITGQLRTNSVPHYPHVEWMLHSTPNTVDAGPAYFSLVADITLVEYMTAAYNKFGLTIYAQTLMKNMPTRAINVNNLPKVLQAEIESRKQRFLDILFNQFFKQNV